ncbi:hypothetical protein MTAT_20030 [Moorella thermoacetica]|uniref:Uncharacterized protein n=1 Tax=Neomoorella thermoacetica TaxID=1525 RepID=A0AAC9MUE0_NEOTH|nr:hypothetical protein [Moorella thermoacetica]AOQ24658.1 hypothetical protein Maut_02230 [Moorella thermoacetica]TYL12761.1 hypothetical protein MTAT_20030 [Moorella thermoacetica]
MDWEPGDLEVLKKMVDVNDLDFSISLAAVTWLPKEIYRYLFEKYNQHFNLWVKSKTDSIKEKVCWLIYFLINNITAGIDVNDIKPEVLCAMATSMYPELNQVAAESINTPSDVLEDLAVNSTYKYVRRAAIANPSLPFNTLKFLYKAIKHSTNSDRYSLLCAIMNNPHCPKEIILDLAMDNDFEISKAAKKKLMTMHEIGEMNYVFYCGPGYSGFRKSAAAGK